MDRDTRKKRVLEIILKTHIETGEPVGSRYISDIMGLSSATIRNIMAEIEDEGYIEQPHTSAGRVPTERAYRLYVNSILGEEERNLFEIKKINETLYSRYRTFIEIMEHASSVISTITSYTSFVIYPKNHIFTDGAYHILDYPEFKNIGKAKNLLRALDDKDELLDIMNEYISSGTLNIRIGRENKKEEFSSCSIITASYKVGKEIVGGVGIIGPIRMKYKRVVPIIRHLAESCSRMLEKIV